MSKDIPCYLLSTLTKPNTIPLSAYFLLWPHSFSPRLLYSLLLRLGAQSAASCSHVSTDCGLFHPEDGDDTFLRNFGPSSTQRHIPEDNILHSHRCESLKSYNLESYCTRIFYKEKSACYHRYIPYQGSKIVGNDRTILRTM
jgi:hypothetical protein